MSTVRFVLDEHMSAAIARQLRRRGINCLTIAEAGRRGLPDSDQLSWALEQGLVLVTYDSDFADLAYAGVEHAGIVVCRRRTREIGAIVRGLTTFGEDHEAEDAFGQLWYV